MPKKLVIVALSISLLVIAACVIYVTWYAPRLRVRKHFPLVATYQFEVKGHVPHENYDQFLRDLDLIVDIGFKGVKLWNIEGYYDINLLDEITRDLKKRNLVFTLPFQVWRREEFPYNKTVLDGLYAYDERTWERVGFIDFVGKVAAKLKTKDNMLWYAVHYPFDWSKWEEYKKRFDDPGYKFELQRIINAINQNDGTHPIYMVLEFPPDFNPPYDLNGIEGFGVQPYSLINDDIDKTRINEHLNFLKKRGNKVYIDEWGVQTEAGFGEYKGTVKHGWASNEESKAKMIEGFVDYILDWEIVWCYFGLHDHWESDWGIVDLDNSLKKGGEAMKAALHKGL